MTANMFFRRSASDTVFVDATVESGDGTQWRVRSNASGNRFLYQPFAVVKQPARTEVGELLVLGPPMHAIFTIIRSPSYTLHERGRILGVPMRLRIHQWLEHLVISIGGPGLSDSPLSGHRST